ncbi:hypothetical protein EAI89_01220 [Eubacterium sp. am_0171]|nr:hypothetical protein EAI89_01220 [Eubacterium sp. am_0171]
MTDIREAAFGYTCRKAASRLSDKTAGRIRAVGRAWLFSGVNGTGEADWVGSRLSWTGSK